MVQQLRAHTALGECPEFDFLIRWFIIPATRKSTALYWALWALHSIYISIVRQCIIYMYIYICIYIRNIKRSITFSNVWTWHIFLLIFSLLPFSHAVLRIKVLIHVRQLVFFGHIFKLFNSGWSSQSIYTYMYAYIFYYF